MKTDDIVYLIEVSEEARQADKNRHSVPCARDRWIT